MLKISGRIILSVLAFLFLTDAYAKESDIKKFIKSGLEYCYQFKWHNAVKDFELIIKNYPDDPRGYHYKSSVYLWYYLSSGNENDLDLFLKFSNTALEKAEAILDKDPRNEEINYISGNSYSCRMLGYAKAESYINAIWSSKKSENYLKKVIEINPANYDAYLGLGLYNFAAAQIPSAFKWALELAGISGDEETGIKYIRLSAEMGNRSKIEAQYYLSQILTGVLMDFHQAGEILKTLNRKYPDNTLFGYSLAVVEMKTKEMDKAEALLKGITVQNHSKFIKIIALSNFLLGDVYFRLNDFRQAIDYYARFLDISETNEYKGIAFLRMGMSYELLGLRDSAVVRYLKSNSGNNDIEDDIYASRKGKLFSQKSFTEVEKSFIIASNQIESGKFNKGYDELSALRGTVLSPVLQAEVYYYLSEAAFHLGKTEESLNHAIQGIAMKTGEEGWINVLCYFNAGRASKNLGRDTEAEVYMEKGLALNDWDYQNRLEYLLESLKSQ